MIASIYHKGLKRLWEKRDSSGLPANHVNKIEFILRLLNEAEKVGDIRFPGASLHPLKGDLKNYWAVTVKANWRIIFRFENGNAYVVDYVDYH